MFFFIKPLFFIVKNLNQNDLIMLRCSITLELFSISTKSWDFTMKQSRRNIKLVHCRSQKALGSHVCVVPCCICFIHSLTHIIKGNKSATSPVKIVEHSCTRIIQNQERGEVYKRDFYLQLQLFQKILFLSLVSF